MASSHHSDSPRSLTTAAVLYGVLCAFTVICAVNLACLGDRYTLPMLGCLLLIPLLAFPFITILVFRHGVKVHRLTPSRYYLALGMAIASLVVILLFYLICPLFLFGVLVPDAAIDWESYLSSLLLPFVLSLLGVALAIWSILLIRANG
ncbi:MAG: hypothetical protein ACOX1O_07770 [Eggerthellaceae bacterium]|jgi:hypothetical protein